jgi:hypothetical protein
MARERRSREWWAKTVSRWRSSGLTAADFAEREDLSVNSLRWWSSEFGRGTRAEHGSSAIEPIELSIAQPASRGNMLEIAVGITVLRCEVGVDVDYLASLVRALRGE